MKSRPPPPATLLNKQVAPAKAEGKCSKAFAFLRKGGTPVTCEVKVGEKEFKVTFSTEDDVKLKEVGTVVEKPGEAPQPVKADELPPPAEAAAPPAAEAAERVERAALRRRIRDESAREGGAISRGGVALAAATTSQRGQAPRRSRPR